MIIAQIFLLYSFWLLPIANAIPYTYQDRIYRFDLNLGTNVAAQAGILFERLPLLRALSVLSYNILAAVIIGISLWQVRRRSPDSANILTGAAIASCLSVLYFVVPTCSPNKIFGTLFPNAMPQHDFGIYTLNPEPTYFRNAMPSLHTVWAILVWINLRYFQPSWRIAVLGATYALLVVIATLGMGEHYLADLIVAVPLAVFVQTLASRDPPWRIAVRWQTLFASVLMTICWLWLICFSSITLAAPLAWGLILATIIVSYLLLRRLIKAQNNFMLPMRSHFCSNNRRFSSTA